MTCRDASNDPSIRVGRPTTRGLLVFTMALGLLLSAGSVAASEHDDPPPPQHTGTIGLGPGVGWARTAAIDPEGRFAYFGATATVDTPPRLVRVDLETFTPAGSVILHNALCDAGGPNSMVIHPEGRFVTVGTTRHPACMLTVDTETMALVETVVLPSGNNNLTSAAIDPAGDFVYFGTATFPARVIRFVPVADPPVATPILTLGDGDNRLESAVIDPEGRFAYFGTDTSPGRVVAIDLDLFIRAGHLDLEDGENHLHAAVIDPEGRFAYFGTDTTPGRVVKVDLATFSRVGSLVLAEGEDRISSAVIDPSGRYGFFGTDTSPGIIVRVDLENMEHAGSVTLSAGENRLFSATITPDGEHAYFGTATTPARIVRLLTQPEVPTDPEGPGFVDPDPDFRFDDVPADHLFDFEIHWLAANEITRGCNPPLNSRFCPDDSVTRGQMAAFLRRALGLSAGAGVFEDSVGHLFEGDIAALAAADVTRGCNPPLNSRFCPDDPVTRGQMAAFLLRALR